jgi:hypothetical protein
VVNALSSQDPIEPSLLAISKINFPIYDKLRDEILESHTQGKPVATNLCGPTKIFGASRVPTSSEKKKKKKKKKKEEEEEEEEYSVPIKKRVAGGMCKARRGLGFKSLFQSKYFSIFCNPLQSL